MDEKQLKDGISSFYSLMYGNWSDSQRSTDISLLKNPVAAYINQYALSNEVRDEIMTKVEEVYEALEEGLEGGKSAAIQSMIDMQGQVPHLHNFIIDKVSDFLRQQKEKAA